LCKNWQLTGLCAFEDSCSFAHGAEELNSKPNIPKNYKTKLCKRFHEDLYCPYGPRCQFKHSENYPQQTAAPSANVTNKKKNSDASLGKPMNSVLVSPVEVKAAIA
jgi:hypothetical protein